ncbi:basic amino acid ABC transporter substrate-binding protein [Defluviitalea phaphyphila]|uniref:basic amino acid ABC transporter substrate-binding protein n=1 Tax=Defluviitalea phaphyphila TaxID=1473580 RepID=UPI000731A6ED|nr:basic amino acid ABC transporter substrate-binding protein [Defluviitalea phaphyphila]
MKKIIYFILIIIMVSGLTGCGKNDVLKRVEKNKVIVMGTNAAFPPFEYREGEEILGFDVEIANKIAEKLGVELKIEDMQFKGLIPALQAGKIDFIAAGMSINEERAKNVDFSDGYYEASQVIITMKDNTEIQGPEDLKNKKIGVQLGTTGDEEASKIEGAEIIKFDTGFMAIRDLQNGKIDAVILDSEPAKKFVEGNEDIQILPNELTKEYYAIAVPKENEEFLEIVNSVLEEMKESGEYDRLIEKYFE